MADNRGSDRNTARAETKRGLPGPRFRGDARMLDQRPPEKLTSREAILKGARSCFARNGFHQTTVEAILQEAGVARSTFYRYFAKLDDLLIVLIEHEFAQMFLEASAAAELPGTHAEQLAQATFHVATGSLHWFKLFGLEDDAVRSSKLIIAAAPDLMQRVAVAFHPMLERGRKSGALRQDLTNEEIIEWLVQNIWTLRYLKHRPVGAMRDWIDRLVVPAVLACPRQVQFSQGPPGSM